MKQIILLALMILMTSQVTAFSDIINSPYSLEILELKKQGIVEGYEDGSFRPNQEINRVEFLKILLESNSELDIHNQFIGHDLPDYYTDTPFGSWYSVYVVAATELGIVEGYPDGTLRPANPINYAEASKVIIETFDFPTPQYFRAPDHWYEPFIDAVNTLNAKPREDIEPSDSVSRGEMAYMIVQAQKAQNGTEVVVDIEISPLRVFDSSHPGSQVTTGYITSYKQWQKARFKPSLSNLKSLDPSAKAIKDELLENVNTERKKKNAPVLNQNKVLADLSQNFVEHLVINGVYSHSDMLGQDPFERAKLAGYTDFVAESMVWNNRDPLSAIEWWKNSAIHWKNIMNPDFVNGGIGIVEEPDGGYIVVLLQGK